MLRQIADHDIRINVSKLEPFLARMMTYSDGTLDVSVICESINLCILVDANIFIGLAAIPKDVQGNHLRAPNHLLALLLSWITDSAWKISLEMDLIYEDKLSKVILPLAEAFAKARSLVDFISFWQEQLAHCQKQGFNHSKPATGFYCPQSLWEDERLLQLIARLAESTLTAGQIYNLILGSHASVLSHETLGPDGNPNLMANLVLLDCAFGITFKDVKPKQITDITRDVYHSSLRWLLNETSWPVEHKWRPWRILIAGQNRRNVTEHHSDIRYLEQQVVEKAVELTTRAQLRDEDSQFGYTEEFYAFAYVIRSMLGQKGLSKHDGKPFHDLIESVIQWIFTHAKKEKGDEKQDQMTSAANPKPLLQWNGQSDGVTSVDILHLCYLAQFLIFPGIFRSDQPLCDVLAFSLTLHRFLEVKQQHRIFQRIYEGAVAFRSSSQAETKSHGLISTPVNYLSLWSKLVNMESLQEDRALKSSEPHVVRSKLLLTR